MAHRRLSSAENAAIPAGKWETWGKLWLDDGRAQGWTAATLENRRYILSRVQWLAAREGWESVGREEMRTFLGYLQTGHLEVGGRWGNAREVTPVRPSTRVSFFNALRTFCAFCVEEEFIDRSPMEGLKRGKLPEDQIDPFTGEQVQQLLAACKRSPAPERNRAILLLLLDTGMRAGELVQLNRESLDFEERLARVVGKGNKARLCRFQRTTKKALHGWLSVHDCREGEPVFVSVGGHRRGQRLTRDGLSQTISELGRIAGIQGVRCSPHTLRHTFAINFLRAGGQPGVLQLALGHESFEMTAKYTKWAQADYEGQHAAFSPVERLVGKKAA